MVLMKKLITILLILFSSYAMAQSDSLNWILIGDSIYEAHPLGYLDTSISIIKAKKRKHKKSGIKNGSINKSSGYIVGDTLGAILNDSGFGYGFYVKGIYLTGGMPISDQFTSYQSIAYYFKKYGTK